MKKIIVADNEADKIPGLLAEFKGIVKSAEGLLAYPFEPVSRIVEELGDGLSDIPEYDELLDQVVSITQKRVGEVEAGRLLLARGFQKFRARLIYDAIRYFGRAQQKLALREAREELSEALFGCGLAYEAAGLLWAARANVLAAANQVLSDYFEHGVLAGQALTCVRRLVWLEIQLGRVACAMQWIQVEQALAQDRALIEEEADKFSRQMLAQDGTLGMLLLRSDLEDLSRLRFLPDAFDRLGLGLSRMALLSSLGHEDALRDEGTIPAAESPEDVLGHFRQWLQQPGWEDLPERPVALIGGRVTLTSHVIGCTLTVHTDDDDDSLLLAERILAAIEALLATSFELDVVPHREEFIVKVERSVRTNGAPNYEFDESHGLCVVHHSGSIAIAPGPSNEWFQDFMLQIVGRIIMPRDLDKYGKRVFGDEGGLARAINFTDTAAPIRNFLGLEAKFRLADWNNVGNPKAYPVRREIPWHVGLLPTVNEETATGPIAGIGDPPKEMLDRSSAKHTSRRVFSLINQHLWAKAKWNATVYAWPEEATGEPILGLAFQNKDAGQEIFREWISKIGREDDKNRLRVSIVTGVNKDHPFAYNVVIGSNIVVPKDRLATKEIVTVSRINRMRPDKSINLDTFEERYGRVGSYLILPAFLPDVHASPELFPDLAIRKQTIRICQAWEVGENDLDSAAIGPDDSPIVPLEIRDAPVLRLLERRKRPTGAII